MFSMAIESSNDSLPVLTMERQIYVNMNLPQCFNLSVRCVWIQPRCGEQCRPLTPPNLAWYNRMSSGLFSAALYFPWTFIPSRGWSSSRAKYSLHLKLFSPSYTLSFIDIWVVRVSMQLWSESSRSCKVKKLLVSLQKPTQWHNLWQVSLKPSHCGIQISYHLSWMSHA